MDNLKLEAKKTKRLPSTEQIALIISILSLVLTLITSYITGIYTSTDLEATISHVYFNIPKDLSSIDSSLRFVLTNNGNKSIAIVGANLALSMQDQESCPASFDKEQRDSHPEVHSKLIGIFAQNFSPFVIKSNDVEARNFEMKVDFSDTKKINDFIFKNGKPRYGCMYLHLHTVAPLFGYQEIAHLVGHGIFASDINHMWQEGKGWIGNNGRPISFRKNSSLY